MRLEMVCNQSTKTDSQAAVTRTALIKVSGTLDVRVRGDKFFPQSVAGRFWILCAISRQIALVFSTAVFSREIKELAPDVIFVDQLSACIPLFRLLYPRARVLFYGHYPDRLLVKQEGRVLNYVKAVYRIPFNVLEGWSTGTSDLLIANSKYTRTVFRDVFPWFKIRPLKVIYPCVDTKQSQAHGNSAPLWPDKKILLSINRFEGKKDLALAIKAYAGLTQEERSRARLVLAGGFDPMNPENATTHKDLQHLAESLNLSHATFKPHDTALTDMSSEEVDILFLLSIPQELKTRLLHSASLLIYTPTNEHFGIVPLEAMLAGVPVLATNTGGPLETIYDGRTGWLRPPGDDNVEKWTEVLRKPLIPSSTNTLLRMGEAGRERVLAEFSETKMAQAFDQTMEHLCNSKAPRPWVIPEWVYVLGVILGMAIPGVFIAMQVLWWALAKEEAKHLAKLAEQASVTITSVIASASETVRDEL